MEEGNPLAGLSATGSVASRFVSQSEIESAKERREADWKAAYARLGQEPPPRQAEDEKYDGRSLYEKLQSNKVAKQEEWEQKNKLSNQFRALDEDEIHFLDGIMEEKITKEKKRKDEENEELQNYRAAVAEKAAQQSAAPPTPAAPSKPSSASSAPTKTQPKKNQKSLLKGAIVRKPAGSKAGSATSPPAPSPKTPATNTSAPTSAPKAGSPAKTTSPPKPLVSNKAETPTSPAKDSDSLGKKRSEASLAETGAENDKDAQASKRQKV
ncbi:hypothetical protein RhiJN_06789 [Ceratobasidium sp. AG-Ba]|nr:hypothetical protein RhiJN_06789 [Ceratobasidium sp. AG-Ba]